MRSSSAACPWRCARRRPRMSLKSTVRSSPCSKPLPQKCSAAKSLQICCSNVPPTLAKTHCCHPRLEPETASK
eukprot:6277192-Pyramimonas_sp.AAC.1